CRYRRRATIQRAAGEFGAAMAKPGALCSGTFTTTASSGSVQVNSGTSSFAGTFTTTASSGSVQVNSTTSSFGGTFTTTAISGCVQVALASSFVELARTVVLRLFAGTFTTTVRA